MSTGDFERTPNKNWAPPQPLQTPFEEARQQWDERIGSARVQAYHWRLFALGCCATSFLCVLGLIYQSSKAQVVPYLVEVESQGQVRLVGEVQEQKWSLPRSARRLFLRRWITNLRSVSSDEQVFTARQAYVVEHLSEAGRLRLEDYLDTHDLFASFGKLRRTVQILSMTTIKGSSQAYRVRWREKTFKGGQLEGTRLFLGEFHLQITPPSEREQLERNPLGIYVDFFDFEEEKPR